MSHRDEIKQAKAWYDDVGELQLAHLNNLTVEAPSKKDRPLALLANEADARHRADQVDVSLDPNKVMPIKRGTQA